MAESSLVGILFLAGFILVLVALSTWSHGNSGAGCCGSGHGDGATHRTGDGRADDATRAGHRLRAATERRP